MNAAEQEIAQLGMAAVQELSEVFARHLVGEGFDADVVEDFLQEKFHGSDSAVPRMPEPRPVKTARAAEEYAAEVMSALGSRVSK